MQLKVPFPATGCPKLMEAAVEYAKLVAKEMKEAKEKLQEQIAKCCGLFSPRASTSESS